MKKILLMLTMVLVLGFSAVCSASNGKVLDAEEAMVDKFLNASKYSAVTAMLSEDMKKEFNEEAFNNFKEQVNKNFGKLQEKKLRFVEKYDDADVLSYQSKFEKVPGASYVFVFAVKNEKPLLLKFNILLPKQEEAQPAAK